MPSRRKINKRNIQRRVFIYCEGEKTEVNYFESLSADLRVPSPLLSIVVHSPPNTDPAGIVRKAISSKRKSRIKDDIYWCVFDMDTHSNVPIAFNLARDHGIKIAYSCICFELWFLLHFQTTPPHCDNCAKMISALKTYIKSYSKNEDAYFILHDKTDIAIRNAESLRETTSGPIHTRIPYTDVDKLVVTLRDLATKITNNTPPC